MIKKANFISSNIKSGNVIVSSYVKSKGVALVVFMTIWTLVIISLKQDYDLLVYPIISIGIAFEVLTTKNRLKVFVLVMCLGVLGWLFQSIESYMGTLIIRGSEPFAPLWLILLWALFMSSTLRTMPFVFKNIPVCFIFGCYSLPGTYYFVSKIGIAKIQEPIWKSLTIDALISGIIFLITYFLLKFYFYKKGDLYV